MPNCEEMNLQNLEIKSFRDNKIEKVLDFNRKMKT